MFNRHIKYITFAIIIISLLSSGVVRGAGLQNYNLGSSGATNYEVGEAVWNGNVFQVQTRFGGTGVLRPVQITTGSNAGLYINTGGNVGIGTTAPAGKLNVVRVGEAQDWLGAGAFSHEQTDVGFTGSSYVLGTFNNAKLSITSGIQNSDVLGQYNLAENNVSGTATYGTYGSLMGLMNTINSYAITGTVPSVFGAKNMFSPESGANDRWTNTYGNWSGFNKWASGNLSVSNYYGFYSDLVNKHANTTVTNGYHFYGAGNYPSYFGGNIGIATTTPLYKLDVVGTAQFSQPVIVGTPTQNSHASTKSYVDSMFSGSGQWTTSGTNIYSSLAGNVGIGTANPGAKLDVRGGMILRGGSYTTDNIINYEYDGLFAANKKWTVTNTGFNGVGNLFDARQETSNSCSALPCSITIDMGGPQHYWYGLSLAFTWGTGYGGSSSFKIEKYYDPAQAGACNSWATVDDVTGFSGSRYITTNNISSYTCQYKITFNNIVGSTNTIHLGEIAAYRFYYDNEGPMAKRMGDTFYGGLNFSGVTSDITTPSGEHFSIMPGGTGNVGIGTTSPTDKLDVAGAIRLTNNVAFSASSGPRIYKDAGLGFAMQAGSGTIADFSLFIPGGTRVLDIPTGTSNLSLQPSASGNVGIATTTPTYKLDVVGTSQFSQPVIVGTPTATTHATTKSYVDSMFSGSGQWTTSGTNIYSSLAGNVGIGTTGPGDKLQVANAGTYRGIYISQSSGSPAITFSNDDGASNLKKSFIRAQDGNLMFGRLNDDWGGHSEKMRITSGGNVGIATTTPGSALSIAKLWPETGLRVGTGTGGDIAITSFSGVGGVIASNYNANGVMTTHVDPTRPIILMDLHTGGTGDPDTFRLVRAPAGTDPPVWSELLRVVGSSGNVGISTSTPTYKLDVVGTSQFSQPVIVGTPTQNSHAATKNYVDSLVPAGGAGWTDAGANVYLTTVGDNVGIGTTGPVQKLDVAGVIRTSASNIGTLNLGANTVGGNIAGQIKATYSPSYGYTGKLSFNVLTNGVGTDYGPTEEMYLEVTSADTKAGKLVILPFGGNVAIGTSTPGSKLTLGPGGAGTYAHMNGGNSDTVPWLATLDNTAIDSAQHGWSFFNSAADGDLDLYRNIASVTESHVMTWKRTDGNVGISTTTPSYKLDVVGTSQFSQPVIVGTPTQNAHATTKSYVDSMFSGSGQWTTSGSNIYSSLAGNVGIGTNSPFSKFTVYGALSVGASRLSIINSEGGHAIIEAGISGITNQGIAFKTANVDGSGVSTKMIIDSSGNVGIGTTSPGVKLDVVGGASSYGANIYGNWTPDGSSLVKNWLLNDGSSNWTLGSATIQTVADGKIGNKVIRSATGAESDITSTGWIPIDPTKTYKISLWARSAGTVSPDCTYFSGRQADGTLSYPWGNGGWGQPYFVSCATIPTSWTYYERTIGPNGTSNFQSAAQYFQVGALLNYAPAENGYVEVQGFRFEELPKGLDIITTSLRVTGSGPHYIIDGNIGVATTTPSYKLDFVGTSRFSQPVIVGTPVQDAHATTKSYVDSMFTGSGQWTTSGTNIYSSLAGNVGIGTTSPSSKLVVSINDSNYKVPVQIINTGTGAAPYNGFDFYTAGTNVHQYLPLLGGTTIRNLPNTPIYFYNNNTATSGITIAAGGNVGIGTTSPGAKLDVWGSEWNNTGRIYSTGSSAGLNFYDTNGTRRGVVYSDSSGFGLLTSATAWAVRVNYGTNNIYIPGNIGIATTTPSYALTVNGYGWFNQPVIVGTPVSTNHAATKSYVDSIVGGGAGSGSFSTLTVSGTSTLSGNIWFNGAAYSNLNMNGKNIVGINKITASVIDPLYEIDGEKYATYGASVVGGIREEYVGRGRLTPSIKYKVSSIKYTENSKYGEEDTKYIIPNTEYSYTIDFNKIERGSDLWVWYNVVDFSKDNVEVLTTAYNSLAKIGYRVEGKKIVFFSDEASEFSFRLFGKRHDWKEWGTKRDTEEEPSSILQSK